MNLNNKFDFIKKETNNNIVPKINEKYNTNTFLNKPINADSNFDFYGQSVEGNNNSSTIGDDPNMFDGIDTDMNTTKIPTTKTSTSMFKSNDLNKKPINDIRQKPQLKPPAPIIPTVNIVDDTSFIPIFFPEETVTSSVQIKHETTNKLHGLRSNIATPSSEFINIATPDSDMFGGMDIKSFPNSSQNESSKQTFDDVFEEDMFSGLSIN